VKKFFLLLPVLLIALFFSGCVSQTAPSKNNVSEDQNNKPQVKENQVNSNVKFPGILADEKISNKKAVIETEKGLIEFELYADKSPKTVSNFVYLAENKFYDGLTFHRVVPGFVIQGGDPAGNGTGGPGYQFEDEKVQGDYKQGTVAMANAGADTNGSQFFICLEDLPTLPKQYNLFGQVTKGLDVIAKNFCR
jgi:cyclophilin family peptidyl-prolyl cis-trans isomerase